MYDNNNRLTSWAGATITYDANGNMTSDGTKTYVWDARDRLVQIRTGATVNASFTYDALGRRSRRTVGSAVTKFLYDGLNPIQEQSASNAATANLLTGLGGDGFISRTTVSDGLTVHFLPDALNSTLALTDSSGAVSTSYTYEPFGKATKTGAATTNTFGFTGREDDGTGLMYYRARYYNPTTQRFISEDPIGLAGGINSYGYASDNPTSYVDPNGRNPLLIAGIAVIVGGVVNGINFYSNGKSFWDGAWRGSASTAAVIAAGGFGASAFLSGAAGGALLTWLNEQAGVVNSSNQVGNYVLGIGISGFGSWAGAGLGGAESATFASIAHAALGEAVVNIWGAVVTNLFGLAPVQQHPFLPKFRFLPISYMRMFSGCP